MKYYLIVLFIFLRIGSSAQTVHTISLGGKTVPVIIEQEVIDKSKKRYVFKASLQDSLLTLPDSTADIEKRKKYFYSNLQPNVNGMKYTIIRQMYDGITPDYVPDNDDRIACLILVGEKGIEKLSLTAYNGRSMELVRKRLLSIFQELKILYNITPPSEYDIKGQCDLFFLITSSNIVEMLDVIGKMYHK